MSLTVIWGAEEFATTTESSQINQTMKAMKNYAKPEIFTNLQLSENKNNNKTPSLSLLPPETASTVLGAKRLWIPLALNGTIQSEA